MASTRFVGRMSAREKIGRLALFLLCVVILSIVAGLAVFSLRSLEPETARRVALISTTLSVALSYMAAYRPGSLFRMLTAGEQEEPR